MSWKASAIPPVKVDDPLAALFRRGRATLRCEIDGKPAGVLGYLRVWVVRPAKGPRTDLDTFLEKETGIAGRNYRRLAREDVEGIELAYLHGDSVLDPKRERILAVRAKAATVLVVVSALTTTEYDKMLPAYVLARNSLSVSG